MTLTSSSGFPFGVASNHFPASTDQLRVRVAAEAFPSG
jgi:hypothetical protein